MFRNLRGSAGPSHDRKMRPKLRAVAGRTLWLMCRKLFRIYPLLSSQYKRQKLEISAPFLEGCIMTVTFPVMLLKTPSWFLAASVVSICALWWWPSATTCTRFNGWYKSNCGTLNLEEEKPERCVLWFGLVYWMIADYILTVRFWRLHGWFEIRIERLTTIVEHLLFLGY